MIRIVHFAATGLLLALCAQASLAQPRRGDVQIDRRNIAIAFRPEDEAIQLPCCRCIDGESTLVSVDTGTAPWTVVAPSPAVSGLAASASHAAWAPLPPATWLGEPAAPSGTYVYTLRFSVPSCVIPSQIVVGGRFAADNDGRLHVDPYPAAIAATPLVTGFLPASVSLFQWSITSPGNYALRVVVRNSEGPVGLIVRGSITMTCSSEVAAPPSTTRVPVDRQ